MRKARTFFLAGIAAGSIVLLAAPPAGAIGARPEDPTDTPAPTAPWPMPGAPIGAPGPAAPPAPAAPQPAPGSAPRTKIQIAEPVEYAWRY